MIAVINQKTAACRVCGNEIKYYLSRRPNPTFCSTACHGKWRRGATPANRINLPNEKIKRLYLDGQTLEQIANVFGVTMPTIASRLEKQGVDRRQQTGTAFHTEEAKAKARKKHPRGTKHPLYISLPIDEIKQAYEHGQSSQAIADRYGVSQPLVLRRLRKAGAKIRRAGYRNNKWIVCADGHLVQSALESCVDDWLYEHGIEHDIHPDCPWSTSGPRRSKADFVARGYFIEVWGIDGNERYDRRRQEKIKLYQECNARLIHIFSHHVKDHDFSPLEILL